MRQDLADRLQISVHDIGVMQVEVVEWPDSGMGCTELSGRARWRAKWPAYRLVLQAYGTRYTFHADTRGRIVLCRDGRAVKTHDDDEAAYKYVDAEGRLHETEASLIEAVLRRRRGLTDDRHAD